MHMWFRTDYLPIIFNVIHIHRPNTRAECHMLRPRYKEASRLAAPPDGAGAAQREGRRLAGNSLSNYGHVCSFASRHVRDSMFVALGTIACRCQHMNAEMN